MAEVAAFYNNQNVMEPGDHPPLLYTSALSHELGHGLQDLGFFRRGLVMRGSQIRGTSIQVPPERKGLLREILTTDQPIGSTWQADIQQTVIDVIQALTLGTYDPESIYLDASMEREMFNTMVNIIMGLNQKLQDSVSPDYIDPHYLEYETPGYYIERASAHILRNSLGLTMPVNEFDCLYQMKSSSATHKAANDQALKLLITDQLPVI